MTKFLSSIHWFVEHPGEVVLAIAIVLAVAMIIGWLVVEIMGRWTRHEEAKAVERRRQFMHRMGQGHSESRPWQPPPAGPKGFGNRRRAA